MRTILSHFSHVKKHRDVDKALFLGAKRLGKNIILKNVPTLQSLISYNSGHSAATLKKFATQTVERKIRLKMFRKCQLRSSKPINIFRRRLKIKSNQNHLFPSTNTIHTLYTVIVFS